MIMTNKITDEPCSGVVAKGHHDALYCALRQMLSAISRELSNNASRQRSGRVHGIGETQTVVHYDRVDQGNNHFDKTRSAYYLYAFPAVRWYQSRRGSTEVELRTVAFEERSMTAAFIFGQNVHFRFELGVRLDGARLSQYLPDHVRFLHV